MSIKEKILEDMKSAMKSRDNDVVSALRLVNSALKNKEIELRPNPLTEEETLGVLKKLVKQRKDSIEQFQAAGRQDLVDKEQNELLVIERYMPAQLGEAEIKKIVAECIQETGASSVKDMGKVMQAVMAKTQGAADNKMVSQVVKAHLQ